MIQRQKGPPRPKQARLGELFGIRRAIGWLLLILAYALALGVYKKTALNSFARSSLETARLRQEKVLNLFQASFYFYYEDQFLPGIREIVSRSEGLDRVLILSDTGLTLFDSRYPPKSPTAADHGKPFSEKRLLSGIKASDWSVIVQGFNVHVVVPEASGRQYAFIYSFDGGFIRTRLLFLFMFGVFLFGGARWALKSPRARAAFAAAAVKLKSLWKLRAKFLLTIVLINLITATIIFWTLTSMQSRDQTEQIEKQSLLFSQFSTSQVIADFTNLFYFYYGDLFLPGVKKIIASNENLVGLKIISCRTGAVLFDSEHPSASPGALLVPADSIANASKTRFTPEVQEALKVRDVAMRHWERDGRPMLSIVNTYRNESQEALFWVEYLFSYESLARSIRAIRSEILIDLVPSLAVGLLIAILFAQVLIEPIRRLVRALQKVTSGDYDVSVEFPRADEIGELGGAFNAMTTELRKKQELRKYLSDSTYRQIMQAPDSPEGVTLGGTRLQATILFSDIRDFVAHCESLEAEEVTSMLNEYFSEMVEVVYKHGGEVDKFIGDALLAVFYAAGESGKRQARDSGDARAQTSDATSVQAIYCAMEMRERLAEFNSKRVAQGKRVLEIGVGITYGEIISGPIGSKDRMDFTVIGDVVNLANRIEKLSKLGTHTKILFSHQVEEKVRGLMDYAPITADRIRGKEEEVKVFELIGIRELEVLVASIKSGDEKIRKQSIELLGQSRNPRAIPHVVEALDLPEEELRLSACAALTKLVAHDDPAALDALFARLAREKSSRVISGLIKSIGFLCGTERIMEIARFLEHGDDRIVANTIEALGQIPSDRKWSGSARDLVLPFLSSRNNRIKANASMALFAAGHFEVIDTLKPMLMHSDALMRSSAAFAIGELTLLAENERLSELMKEDPDRARRLLGEIQECVPMLVLALRDSEAIVKRQAIIALGKIKDSSAVLPIIENLDPSKDSKELLQDVTQALRSIGSHKMVREVVTRLGQ